MIKSPMGHAQKALLLRAEKDTEFFGRLRCASASDRLFAKRLERRGYLRRITHSYFEMTPEGIEAAARLKGRERE